MLLTNKQLEMLGFVISILATDALVLEHQAISTQSADLVFVVQEQFH